MEQEALRKKSDALAGRLESIFVQVNQDTEHLTEDVMKKMASLTREAAENAINANDLIGQTGDVVVRQASR